VSLLVAVLLGIVQGLTEFLPVSSSAHLILARAFFGWEMPEKAGLAFDVAVHVGTLAAILVFFRREVAAMVASSATALSSRANAEGRLARMIVIGTLPVVVVGLLFSDVIEAYLRTPAVAVGALTVGALAMLAAERTGLRERTEASLGWADAILIGIAQASALIPGMSRSGTTIAVGMFLGMRRDAAARFTFLLAIPAMCAAAGKEGLALVRAGDDAALDLRIFAAGMIASAVVGYLTIKYFLRFLAGNRLDLFAYYRLALAAVTLAWLVA
jgi:undecaprenyl-diphosphatase